MSNDKEIVRPETGFTVRRKSSGYSVSWQDDLSGEAADILLADTAEEAVRVMKRFIMGAVDAMVDLTELATEEDERRG